MPGDGKQADEERRQADGDKPHRPDAVHLDVDVKPGDLPRLWDVRRGQQRNSSCRHRQGAGNRPAKAGNGAAEGAVGAEHQRQHGADEVPAQRLVN